MFLILLIATLLVAVSICYIVVRIFNNPLHLILNRMIEESISGAWLGYLKFAMFVVGISSGVRIWQLEKYITPTGGDQKQVVLLTFDRWILELYRTVIGTLQGIAWLLLIFFIFALISYVIVRLVEFKK